MGIRYNRDRFGCEDTNERGMLGLNLKLIGNPTQH